MSRLVTYARCGTEESWEKHKEEYPGSYHVIPASVYVSETGICLVTSKEWVDWLLGKTDKIPNTDDMNINLTK